MIPSTTTSTPVAPYQMLTSPNPTLNGEFGKTVTIYQSSLMIGAPYEGVGAVYWYSIQNGGTVSSPVARVTPPSGWGSGDFGVAVSLDEADVYIGADSGTGIVFRYYFNNLATGPSSVPLKPIDSVSTNTGFGQTIANGKHVIVIGFPGEGSNATGATSIGVNNAVPVGSGALNSGAVYVVEEDCGLIALPNSAAVPATYCTPNNSTVYVLESVNLSNTPNTNLTLPSTAPTMNVMGNFTLSNTSTLNVIAGTLINITGFVSLNNSRLILNTLQSTYVPGSVPITIPFLLFNTSDNSLFGNITLQTGPTQLSCQSYGSQQNRFGGGLNIQIYLNESACQLQAAEQTSLVAAILLLIIGLPTVIVCTALSQYYLGKFLG